MKKMGYLCFQYITRKEYIPFLSRGPCSHYVVRYHYIDDAPKEEIIDPREETKCKQILHGNIFTGISRGICNNCISNMKIDEC